MVILIDYGMGNLRSAQKAFEYIGCEARITSDPAAVREASHVVLPGVGAFKDAIDALRSNGLDQAALEAIAAGKPFLGICLGMQLLFNTSYENGVYKGLSVFDGDIELFKCDEKIPHMGWNEVEPRNNCPILKGIPTTPFYFVHSYYAPDANAPYTGGVTQYGNPFTSVAYKDNVYATQFHPEKSSAAGLQLLKNFVELR